MKEEFFQKIVALVTEYEEKTGGIVGCTLSLPSPAVDQREFWAFDGEKMGAAAAEGEKCGECTRLDAYEASHVKKLTSLRTRVESAERLVIQVQEDMREQAARWHEEQAKWEDAKRNPDAAVSRLHLRSAEKIRALPLQKETGVLLLEAYRTLVDYAERRISHLNDGRCPDEFEGHDSRDPECVVCQSLETVKEECPVKEPADVQ